MKEIKKQWSIMIDEISWGKMSIKQKSITIWFSVSFVLLLVCSEGLLLAMIATTNFGIAAYSFVKNVPIEE